MGKQGDPSEYKNGMRVTKSSSSSSGSTVTLSDVADATTWSKGSSKATFSFNGTQQDLYVENGKAYDSWGNVRGTIENGHIVVTNKEFNSMFGNSTGSVSNSTTVNVKQGDHVTSASTYAGSNVTINNYGIMDTITTGKNSSLTLNNYGTVKNEVRLGENGTAVINNYKGAYIKDVIGGDITDKNSHKGINATNYGEIHYIQTGAYSTNEVFNYDGGYVDWLKTGYGNSTTTDGGTNKRTGDGKVTDITGDIITYLKALGFTINDSKTSKGNGTYDVEKSSALIIVQWYLKKKGKKVQLNGTFDKATLDALVQMKKEKNTIRAVREEMEDFIKNWEPEKPSLGTDRYSPNNGHLETKDMVRVPSVGGGFAIAETNTAVAWAMMVQGAIDYNEKGQYTKLEVSDYGKQLNIGNFLITGSDSGYRNYHKQVEAAMDWARRGVPGNASPINFKYKTGKSEFEKLRKKLGSLPKNVSGGWNNIADWYTDEGGPLYGSGTSNHGLGAAMDLNFGMGQHASIGTNKTRHWVEDFGRNYGFEGLYLNGARKYIEKNGVGNFSESWHLTYYGPNVQK